MKHTLSLDGDWHVIFDHQNRGRLLNWQHRDDFHGYHDIEQVTVPACLEEFRQDYEGVAWYGKTFELPAEWHGTTIRLCFEAVNYRAEVWVNGRAAGHHEGGYTGFAWEIDDLLHADQANFIAVRVITPLITRDVVIDGLGRDDMPHWRGAIAGGIWQSVCLVATDAVYIDDAFVSGNIESGAVAVEATLRNTRLESHPAALRWDIVPHQDDTAVVSASESLLLRPGTSRLQREFTVTDHKLWQLADPQLYRLTIRVLLQGTVSDEYETRFGFREFTVKGKNFYLNGEKIILKTVFNEAFYPHSLAYPRDRELLEQEFRLVKEGHINMIRPWRKPQPPVVYDLADEMGILFVGALPVECMDHWPQITPYTRQRIENEVTEMVLRDRNHPSIVIWEMFNEILRDDLKRLRHSTALKARELDETRLIMDEAGGFAGVCSLYLPGMYEPTLINDVHDYPGAPLDQASYDNLLILGKTAAELAAMGRTGMGSHTRSQIAPGLLTNISELGYGSIPDLEANMARYRREGNPLTPDYRIHERLYASYQSVLAQSGVHQIFPTFRDFVAACQEIHYVGNKLMAEACRINPDIAGIGIHALNDGDWIVGAGLIDNFRNPKRAYYAIQEVFADRYIAVRPSRQNLYTGQDLHITLTAVNDQEALAGTVSVRVTARTGRVLLEVQDPARWPEGIGDLGTYAVSTDEVTGLCRVEVAFDTAAADTVRGSSSFLVLDPAKSRLPAQQLAVVEFDGTLSTYLQRMGTEFTTWTQETPDGCPVLVNWQGWRGEPLPGVAELAPWVQQGGQAVLLGVPSASASQAAGPSRRMWKQVTRNPLLPFDVTYFNAKGTWVPCSHVVKDHPIYDGLPTNCLMGQEYRDVVARWSMAAPASDWISGTITYDWYAGLKHKQNYTGVSAAMHGADLTLVPYGQGCYLLCTHRIVEHLGQDPVADRLFSNLLRWVAPEA